MVVVVVVVVVVLLLLFHCEIFLRIYFFLLFFSFDFFL